MMSERELFEENIPKIAELIIELRKFSAKEYLLWKTGVITNTPESVKGFIEKIFIVIDKYL